MAVWVCPDWSGKWILAAVITICVEAQIIKHVVRDRLGQIPPVHL